MCSSRRCRFIGILSPVVLLPGRLFSGSITFQYSIRGQVRPQVRRPPHSGRGDRHHDPLQCGRPQEALSGNPSVRRRSVQTVTAARLSLFPRVIVTPLPRESPSGGRANSEKALVMTINRAPAAIHGSSPNQAPGRYGADEFAPLPIGALSIAELLSTAGEGNPAAWEEIIRRYGGLVRAKASSFRLQDADALDAVQMTWLRLAENCHRIQFPERLGGWLATTASRECLRILRQAKRTPYTAEAMTRDVADPSIGPEQHIIDTATAQELWNLVAELPPRGRNLLQTLFTDAPLPYSEVARTIGIPIGSIGPTRARALQQLRRMVGERGLEI